jgi:hypothetical protein
VTYKKKQIRAVELLYDYVYGEGIGQFHRRCSTAGCINPHHYVREVYMKLDPFQAEQIWLNLYHNPRKATWPCASALELKNNRSALYRAREKLISNPEIYNVIKNYEIGKDATGLNILLQSSKISTEEAAAQLRAQGFTIHTHTPPTPNEAFNAPTPKNVHPLTGLPIDLNEDIVETDDMLANIGYGAPKIKPDENNT